MNVPARPVRNAACTYAILVALHHLATGLPEVLRIGPRFLPASWAIIYEWLPAWFWWVWPGLYVATGICALWGTRRFSVTLWSIHMSAMIHLTWGSVSLYGWSTNRGGTIPGSLTYWFLAGTLWFMAYLISLGNANERR